MWPRLLTNLLFLGTAFALDLKGPLDNIPSPTEVERKNVQRARGGTSPQLQGEGLPSAPPPPPETSIKTKEVPVPDVKELKRQPFEVRRGEDLSRKEEKNQQTQAQPQSSQQQSAAGAAEKREERREVVYRGYCRFLRDYQVSLEPVFAQVECMSIKPTFFARGEMLLRPEPQSFALRGELISLDGKEVQSIKVLTSSRSSANIADEVDKKLIANMLLKAGKQTGRDTSDMVRDIFRSGGDKRQTLSGGTLVVEEKVKDRLKSVPEAAGYMAMANLLSSASETFLEDRGGLPPLFKVRARTEVYVEFSFGGEKR